MKIALCLRGHVRNYAVKNSIDILKNSHELVDVYIHTFDTLHPIQPHNIEHYVEGEVHGLQLEQSFLPKKYVIEKYDDAVSYVDKLSEELIETWFTVNEFNNPVTKEDVTRRCFLQLYKTAKVINLIDNIDDYDCIIVTRPDIEFTLGLNQTELNNKNIFISGNFKYERTVNSSGKFTGLWCDDLLRVGTPDVIKQLADSCENIRELVLELREKDYFEIAGDTHKIQAYAVERLGLNISANGSISSTIIR